MTMLQSEVQINKRKNYIRNASLIFIVIILLLTFFSKTINNFLLPSVETTKPSSGTLMNEITAQGEVFNEGVESIYSFGDWKIKDIKVKPGDEIKKGDILATVDPEDIALDMKKMELNLLKVENELLRYKNGFQEKDIELFRNDAEAAKREVQKAEDNLAAQKELYALDAVALEIVNDAQDRLHEANRNYEQKQRLVEQKEDESTKAAENYQLTLKEKEAELEVSKLEFDEMKKNISEDGTIKSPVDGVINSNPVDKGTTVNSGRTLFEIIKKGSEFAVKWPLVPDAAKEVNIQDAVAFTSGADKNFSLGGFVIGKNYDAKEGKYEFISFIKSNGSKDKALPQIGQIVDVSIKKASKRYKMIVPNSSITKEADKEYVFIFMTRQGILGDENYVQKIEVKVEEHDDFDSAIKDIKVLEDARVVTHTTKLLFNNAQVKLR